MIRLLLAAIAIVLYLVLTFPVLCFLEKKAKRTRRRQAGRAFPWCGGFLKKSARSPGSHTRCGGWKIFPPTGRYFMWETTEVILILSWLYDRSWTDRFYCQKGNDKDPAAKPLDGSDDIAYFWIVRILKKV